jgi:hypothetical protein
MPLGSRGDWCYCTLKMKSNLLESYEVVVMLCGFNTYSKNHT